ncbi:MAG: radical SAM protein [Rhodospirillaceae bacterium]
MAFYPQVPAISLELINRCNLKCPYCANGTLSRPRGSISWSLLEKLVCECSGGRHDLAWLHGTGEPLLWSQLENAIVLIKSMKAGEASFATNATLLSPERTKSLLNAGLTSIYVSIDTLDPVLYQRTRGGDLNKVIANVQSLIALVPPEFRITIALMNHKDQRLTAHSIWQFYKTFGFHSNIQLNQIENTLFPSAPADYRTHPGKSASCSLPRNYMTIAYDGRVALCCVDQDVLNPIGDVSRQTIEEVWFDPIVQNTFWRIASGAPNCPALCTSTCMLATNPASAHPGSAHPADLQSPTGAAAFDDLFTLAQELFDGGRVADALAVAQSLVFRNPARRDVCHFIDGASEILRRYEDEQNRHQV